MDTHNAPKPTERLEFTNHLMFNAVLTEDEELCRKIISAVLGKSVGHIEYLDGERSIQPELDARGARLDLLALVDGEYVDIEMQVGHEPDIERRCRFYHGAIATRFTPKGANYGDIPRSYVIFICLGDPLGDGLVRYELATSCTNAPHVPVDDGATTILLNASAWEQEEDADVAGMLRYSATGHADGDLAVDIAKAVDLKNLDRKWVRATMGIMTYEHEMRVLNAALDRRKAAAEAAQAELEAKQVELDAKRSELEAKRAELDVAHSKLDATQTELEAKYSELEAAQSELISAQSELEAAQSELDSKQSELEAAQSELDSKQSELVSAQSELEAAQSNLTSARSELDATTKRSRALQELSKKLYSAGRIDEYFVALDDESLMRTLLEEFSL